MDSAIAFAYRSMEILAMKNLWYIDPILSVERPEKRTSNKKTIELASFEAGEC